jgi:hypothetical protein
MARTALLPHTSVLVGLARESSRNSKMAMCPPAAAMCTGVRPERLAS